MIHTVRAPLAVIRVIQETTAVDGVYVFALFTAAPPAARPAAPPAAPSAAPPAVPQGDGADGPLDARLTSKVQQLYHMQATHIYF